MYDLYLQDLVTRKMAVVTSYAWRRPMVGRPMVGHATVRSVTV